MAINVGTFIVKNQPTVIETFENKEVKTLPEVVQMEEGTVMHNGKPKKFNKKMSQYMIDMLTTED